MLLLSLSARGSSVRFEGFGFDFSFSTDAYSRQNSFNNVIKRFKTQSQAPAR